MQQISWSNTGYCFGLRLAENTKVLNYLSWLQKSNIVYCIYFECMIFQAMYASSRRNPNAWDSFWMCETWYIWFDNDSDKCCAI